MLIQSQARSSFIQGEKMNCPDSGFGQYEGHLLTSSGRGRAMLLEGARDLRVVCCCWRVCSIGENSFVRGQTVASARGRDGR